MCGITGIVDLERRRVDESILARMNARLLHRGPDDEGRLLRDHVALGLRRLSIVDLPGGHQPLGNEDGTVWVTFNGEIYNFVELRETLQGRGHQFATSSDTEVIVHAYEEFGEDCVSHFRGMFAFGLWDERRQTLLLARDRLGKKPLYYARAGGQVIFASELQGLLEHPALPRETNPSALADYLTYGYIPAPKTAFRGVHKLPPGCCLTVQVPAGEGVPRRYWELARAGPLPGNEEEAAEGLLEVLGEAVRLRLRGDVGLGVLLSGGVDSSLIVALMSRLTGERVRTFSIGFEEQGFNELPYARLVARHFQTDHHESIVRPSAMEVLPLLVKHYGEPFADSSAIPTYYVAKMTREHVKVALNGDGGDECMGGYDRYLANSLADRYRSVPALLRRAVVEPLSRLVPNFLPRRHRLQQARRFLQVAGQLPADRYLRWVSYFTPEAAAELYTPEFRAELAGHEPGEWLRELFAAASGQGLHGLDVLLAVDVQSYLPYDLLVKMDIATMANSLEARSPFLDHKVMEYCARLPARYKIRGTTLKYLLKKIGRRLLPPAVVNRRKMGFGVPVAQWMRGELRPLLEEVVLSPGALQCGYFQPQAVRRLVRTHLSGEQDHSFQLWALLVLELWRQAFRPV